MNLHLNDIIPKCPARRTRRRSGSILIVTTLVCFALAAMVMVLCQTMRVEAMAAANSSAAIQANSVERGAEQYVLSLLANQLANPGDTNYMVSEMLEDSFAGNQIGGNIGGGYFWILRPDYLDDGLPIFGLTEESAKLNINTASYDQLLLLPNMTEDIASAIVDWRDTDSTVSNNGAEDDYYTTLPDPYHCKNAPFETVEEMFLLRNVTQQMMYGDGTAGPLGVRTGLRGTTSDLLSDPQLARGYFDLLTVYSAEPDTAADGTARVNINTQRNQLQTLLQEKLSTSRAQQIVQALGQGNVTDIFDLYGRARLSSDEFDLIADYITSAAAAGGGGGGGGGGGATATATPIQGRININMAPEAVLACLNGLESADVSKLIAQRQSTLPQEGQLGWVYEALQQRAVGLGSQITTHSYQYTADILAVSTNGRAFKRYRIVVDMSNGTNPQIIYRRDLTYRGWPMDEQVRESLRTGEGQGVGAVSDFSPGGAFR